jgi:hypothetical protein
MDHISGGVYDIRIVFKRLWWIISARPLHTLIAARQPPAGRLPNGTMPTCIMAKRLIISAAHEIS